MTPKWPKVSYEASSSSKKVNFECFMIKEVEEQFKQDRDTRGLIRERGIELEDNPIKGMIEEECLEELVKQPLVANIPMVREFYANVLDHGHHKVMVRGKLVPCDATFTMHTIIFKMKINLMIMKTCEKLKLGRNYQFSHDGIAIWKKDASDEEKKLSSSTLTTLSKFWHQFLFEKLLPSSYTSQVMKDSAILNFALQNDYASDIGRVIAQSILNTANKVSIGFWHPLVIYMHYVNGQRFLTYQIRNFKNIWQSSTMMTKGS